MITPQDRKKYRNYTDDSILGIKLIGGLTNKVLLAHKNGDEKIAKLIKQLMGGKTNPNWISGQLADELFARNMIDEDEHCKITGD